MRLFIASLALFLVALPAMLGAPPYYLIGSSTSTWLEFARTFAGALAGAGVAFLLNIKLQERLRRKEEVAAGMYAMATLARQYNNFLNLRRVVEEETQRGKREAPHVPLWFLFRPITHFLQEDVEIDFRSLTFVFEDGNIDVFEHLFMVEAIHRDLMGYVNLFSEGSKKKQDRLQAAGFDEDPDKGPTPTEARKAIGVRLQMEIESNLAQIQMHLQQDRQRYLDAAAALHRALSQRFGPGVRLIRLVA